MKFSIVPNNFLYRYVKQALHGGDMFRSGRAAYELGAALALYIVLLFAANIILSMYRPAGLWLFALSMVPMIGAVAMAWTVLRGLHRMDELQRRIQFDAIAIAFLGTALITSAGDSVRLPDFPLCVLLLSGRSWGVCGSSASFLPAGNTVEKPYARPASGAGHESECPGRGARCFAPDDQRH